MKTFLIICLTVLSLILGLGMINSRNEVGRLRDDLGFYEKRNSRLQAELMRLNADLVKKKQLLDAISRNIKEIDDRMGLEKLLKYIPRKKRAEIQPFISDLKSQNKIENLPDNGGS